MALLTKGAILEAEDRKFKDVDVPEWGGSVRIAVMSAEARDRYESSLMEMQQDGTATKNLENIRAKLVSACIVDENGKTMFTYKELADKSGRVLDRLFNECSKLNALGEEGIEDAAKNS